MRINPKSIPFGWRVICAWGVVVVLLLGGSWGAGKLEKVMSTAGEGTQAAVAISAVVVLLIAIFAMFKLFESFVYSGATREELVVMMMLGFGLGVPLIVLAGSEAITDSGERTLLGLLGLTGIPAYWKWRKDKAD